VIARKSRKFLIPHSSFNFIIYLWEFFLSTSSCRPIFLSLLIPVLFAFDAFAQDETKLEAASGTSEESQEAEAQPKEKKHDKKAKKKKTQSEIVENNLDGEDAKEDAKEDALKLKNGYGLFLGKFQLGGGGGVEFSRPINPKLRLVLQVSSATDNNVASGDVLLLETSKINQQQVAIKGKMLFTETFFATAGLSYGILGGQYGMSLNNSTSSSKQEILWTVNGRRIDLSIGVGNEWVWPSGFFIGAEWLGYSQALSSSVGLSSSKTTEQSEVDTVLQSTGNKKAIKDWAKDYVGKNNVYAVLLSVGKRI